MPCTNRTLPILNNPTRNEKALWTWLSNPCLNFLDPCIVPPILDDPNACELILINAIISGQCKVRPCALMPLFPPGCSTNLEELILHVDAVLNPVFGGGGAVCGPTGLPLSISTLDPNQPGAENGEITCDTVQPEIRLTAAGGVSPYTWSIANEKDGCPLCDIGGAGLTSPCAFGPPSADGVCNSRFVITTPRNAGGFPGFAASYYVAKTTDPSDCDVGAGCAITRFDCDDVNLNNTTSNTCKCHPDSCPPVLEAPDDCTGLPHVCHQTDPGIVCGVPKCPPPGGFTGFINFMVSTKAGIFTDCRTTAMEDDACCPCALVLADVVVTVTDAIGTMVSITLTVSEA